MNRRQFLGKTLAAGAGAALLGSSAVKATPIRTFGLKLAPHLGMFRRLAGDDPVAQLEFIADQGFAGLEDSGMRSRPVPQQELLADAMEALGLEMGLFVATASFAGVTFAGADREARTKVLEDIRASVEVAGRVRARWCAVVLGRGDEGLSWDAQTAKAVDLLKRCAAICEPAGLTMVLEALDPWRSPGSMFLRSIRQAVELCRAVSSPACKVLFDVCRQQATGGSILASMDQAWDQIAYIQVGDNPGRKEPTTGEINYCNVFAHLKAKGYQGLIGMEHGNSRPGGEGERAVIDAYVLCDNA